MRMGNGWVKHRSVSSADSHLFACAERNRCCRSQHQRRRRGCFGYRCVDRSEPL